MSETIWQIIFAVVSVLFLLVFGRLFCGKLCPIGIAQDLLHKIPFPKKIKTFAADKYLRYIKFGILLVPLVSIILGLSQNMDRETRPQSLVVMLVFMAIAGLICIMMSRPFCKYFCLVGAVSALANKISFYKYRVKKDSCVHCNLCSKACPMNIEPYKKPNSLECIRCRHCIQICPKNAIISGFRNSKEETA
ncbi:4Fe-4S binding protein [Treponema primitia]|uniref:4Fe-4S binding protein n=1 Tax=Treponema primitia TaxID=88058 RepID=UPI0039800CA8